MSLSKLTTCIIVLLGLAMAPSPSLSAGWGSAAYSTASEAGAWLGHYSKSKSDEPTIKELLETGETGVCQSWLNEEDGSVRKGNPQPPHPQSDGTIQREIEVLDVNGRYVRVLWIRDVYGVWTKQDCNFACRRVADNDAIAKEVYGPWGGWLKSSREKEALGIKVRENRRLEEQERTGIQTEPDFGRLTES